MALKGTTMANEVTSNDSGASGLNAGVRHGAIERELETAMGLASCRGDEDAIDEAKAELAQLRMIEEAAKNFCRVKGRHNSEIAMRRLMRACGFEMLPNTCGTKVTLE